MLLITLLLTFATPTATPEWARPSVLSQDDFSARFKRARGDVKALWELADWCAVRGMIKERDRTLLMLLRTEPENRKARELLKHIRFEGQWFTSQKKLDVFMKKRAKQLKAQADREAKAKGWVKRNGEWIDPADLIYLERGWFRLEDGTWVTPEEKERLDEGWFRQDLEWVAPEDAPKIGEGLWKCDSDWLALEQANAYHAELDRWWRIPGRRMVLWSTCDRQQSEKALKITDDAYLDLVRLFGVTPEQPPSMVMLRDLEQYLEFSKEGVGPVGKSMLGLDSLRGTFFADLWVKDDRFFGTGIAYWNAANKGEDRWGSLWVRHAAGQAFVEAIDSSPEARAALADKGDVQGFAQNFWDEKVIPPWLRYGAASYAERYFIDPSPGSGNDSLWPRKWSAADVASKGGLDPFDELFEFRLTMDDGDRSLHLLNQVGLLVAFLLDGESPVMKKALDKLHLAMKLFATDPKKGRGAIEKAVAGIERALKKSSKDLSAFAGF